MKTKKWILASLCLMLFMGRISNGQSTKKVRKNSIELLFPYYNFLDGSPKVPIFSYFGTRDFGLSYNRILPSKKCLINLTVKNYSMDYTWYYSHGLGKLSNLLIGDIIYRDIAYISSTYFRSLLNPKWGTSYLGGGINIRLGTEATHWGYYGWEEISNQKPLLDAGLSFALMEKINLPFHFMLTGQMSFTRYLWRYYRGGATSYDKGSTKNLFSYQLGIGYRFGKSSEAEKMARKERRDQKIRKNSVELNNSVSNFFDGTKTNWLIVYPVLINNYDTSGNVSSSMIQYFFPFSFGLQYSRILNNENTFRFSVTHYNMGYELYRETKPGEVFRRTYNLFSTSYLYNLSSNKQLKVQALGALNYRTGYDEIKIDDIITPNGGWDAKTGKLPLNDIGLSAGLRVEQSLASHLFLSAETKYTRFIYRGSKGIDFNGGHKKAAPNTFTIKLGVGYRF